MADRRRPQNEVKIRYTRSNSARVIHADGAWGGLTTSGHIFISFFSDLQSPPDHTTYTVEAGRVTGEQPVRSGGPIREIEVDVIMNIDVARSVRDWFDQQIKARDELAKQLEQDQQKKVD